MNRFNFIFYVFTLFFICLLSNLAASDDTKNEFSKGQTIYVPAYSQIYFGDREQSIMLTVTLSIRNIDMENIIEITLVDYYETQGNLIKKHIEKPVILKPLESLRYIIPESNKSGGSGANFIVKWESDKPSNPPIIESIMISTKSAQGISFTSRGREIISSK